MVAKEKTSDALRNLMELQPTQAVLLSEGLTNRESEIDIDVRLLQHSDILKIVPGARIPTDGFIVMGETTVDESMITGESQPVLKKCLPSKDKYDYNFTNDIDGGAMNVPVLQVTTNNVTCCNGASSPPTPISCGIPGSTAKISKCCSVPQVTISGNSYQESATCNPTNTTRCARKCSDQNMNEEICCNNSCNTDNEQLLISDGSSKSISLPESHDRKAKSSCCSSVGCLSLNYQEEQCDAVNVDHILQSACKDVVGQVRSSLSVPRSVCCDAVTDCAAAASGCTSIPEQHFSPLPKNNSSLAQLPVPSVSQVLGGTINQTGLIYIHVTRVVAENTLSQISHMVQQAQLTKPPVQRLADRVAAIMVPAIVVLSFTVFLFWFGLAEGGVVNTSIPSIAFALKFALATLVVSCPCAVGLAVPTAIMVGTGVGARYGVLFADGSVIEHTHKVNTVIFDKTGTITQGKPRVNTFQIARKVEQSSTVTKGLDEKSFWYLLGSAEMGSEHVLGRAIVDHARSCLNQRNLQTPSEFQAYPGKGLSCNIDGHALLVGHLKFLVENEISIDDGHAVLEEITALEHNGCTVVCMAVDSLFAGMVALKDLPKPEARVVVEQLTRTGVEVWMLSGDDENTALRIAAMVGIDSSRVKGRLLPNDKAAHIVELQGRGQIVCMVGDGINDSPALTQANVGVAVGTGTDTALAAADIVLVKNDLRDLLIAMELSCATFKCIKVNFFWAFLYNLIAIPLAIGVFYPLGGVYIPPPIAGLSELFSSLPVVLSSLLLRRFVASSSPILLETEV